MLRRLKLIYAQRDHAVIERALTLLYQSEPQTENMPPLPDFGDRQCPMLDFAFPSRRNAKEKTTSKRRARASG